MWAFPSLLFLSIVMIFSVDLSIQQINREVRSSRIVGLYEVMVMAGELVEFEEGTTR